MPQAKFLDAVVTHLTTSTNQPVNKSALLDRKKYPNLAQLRFIHCDGTGSTITTSGGVPWVQIGTTQNIPNGDTATFAAFYQVPGEAEPATYNINTTGGLVTTVIDLLYWDVDQVNPIALKSDGTLNFAITNPNSASPPASPVSIAATGITTLADLQRIVGFMLVDWNAASAATFGDPSNTGLIRRGANTPAAFTNGLAFDFVQAAAGATGTVTGTGTLAGQSGNYGAVILALNNAPNSPDPKKRRDYLYERGIENSALRDARHWL